MRAAKKDRAAVYIFGLKEPSGRWNTFGVNKPPERQVVEEIRELRDDLLALMGSCLDIFGFGPDEEIRPKGSEDERACLIGDARGLRYFPA